MSVTVLILPGIENSGPAHWQSLWERTIPGAVRVAEDDWDRPVRAVWVAALRRAVADAAGAVVLVAHSLGCLQVAHAAAGDATFCAAVSGALLVAPPNPDAPSFPEVATGFSPLPLAPLPFPTTLVASRNDLYSDFEFSRCLAAGWGSQLVDAGPKGHLNAASGLGAWPEGRAWLAKLIAAVGDARAR